MLYSILFIHSYSILHSLRSMALLFSHVIGFTSFYNILIWPTLLISLLALFSSFSSDGLDDLYIIACASAITAGLSSAAYRILCIAATIYSKLQLSKSDICHSIKLMQKTFLDKRLYMASKIWLDKRFDCSRWILISRWISGNIGFQPLYIRTMSNFCLCLVTNNWHPSC